MLLRNFNSTEVHESEFNGENPKGIPNKLMHCIGQVVSEKIGVRERVW